MGSMRRSFSAAFKSKVSLAALRGDRTLPHEPPGPHPPRPQASASAAANRRRVRSLRRGTTSGTCHATSP